MYIHIYSESMCKYIPMNADAQRGQRLGTELKSFAKAVSALNHWTEFDPFGWIIFCFIACLHLSLAFKRFDFFFYSQLENTFKSVIAQIGPGGTVDPDLKHKIKFVSIFSFLETLVFTCLI